MKKPSKTAAELEASIKVEMEEICDWPTDMTVSVQPDGDSWKVAVIRDSLGALCSTLTTIPSQFRRTIR
jgi:hypothetical protein